MMNSVFRAASVAALSMLSVGAISNAVRADSFNSDSAELATSIVPALAVEANATNNIVFESAEVVQPVPTTEKLGMDGSPKALDPLSRGSRKNNLGDAVGSFRGDMSLNGEERCLAGAIYFESKGEPLEGQMAVAHVILNRVSSGRFAGSICGVVYQKSQFSFVRGGRMPSIPEGSSQWKTAVAVAKTALADAWESPVGGAMYFHATYVSPGWKRARVRTIGNHVFYR